MSITQPIERRSPRIPVAQCLFSFLLVWIAGGATCFRREPISVYPPAPAVWESMPTAEEVVQAVNRNDRIERMQGTGVSVELLDSSMPISKLDATLVLERPGRLRLRARVPMLLSSGLDVGSNDELFWMRYPEGMHQTLVYARHDEYDRMLGHGVLPVNPTWIVQALGLMHIDPQYVTEGPIPLGEDAVELRLDIPTGSGTYRHVVQVQRAKGYVLSHMIFDPSGRMVARADSSNHGYYETEGVVLPHTVRVRLLPATAPPIALQIDVGGYTINQFLSEDPQRFVLPSDGNAQVIDLARGSLPPGAGFASPEGTSPLPPAQLDMRSQAPPAYSDPAAGPTPIEGYVPTASFGTQLRGTMQR